MATAKSQETASSAKQKKTVTVVAYAANDAFKSERAMADELDEFKDYYARTRNKSRKVKLVYDDGEQEMSETVFSDNIRDALVDGGVNSDHLTVSEEVNVSRPYAHSPSQVVTQTRDDITEQLPEDLSGGVTTGWWSFKWQNDDSETKVEIRAGDIDYRRILVHRSERGGRRKYESRTKRLSMDFTIKLGPDREDIVSAWNDEVVAEFVKALAHVGWVQKVRVTDCVESVEREGDCFSV